MAPPLEIFTDNDSVIFRRYTAHPNIIKGECSKIVANALENNYIDNISIDKTNVTISTPKGKATAKCTFDKTLNLNVGIATALAKLNCCNLPDGFYELEAE